ncbi:MAG TPA: hypothetical protein VIY86_02280, partial [Pirellulaceae bacterium]
MKHVLVIDRTAVTRPTWKKLLSECADCEADFADAEGEILVRMDEYPPDAILLNPASEGLDGPRFVEVLHDRFPHIPIVL